MCLGEGDSPLEIEAKGHNLDDNRRIPDSEKIYLSIYLLKISTKNRFIIFSNFFLEKENANERTGQSDKEMLSEKMDRKKSVFGESNEREKKKERAKKRG